MKKMNVLFRDKKMQELTELKTKIEIANKLLLEVLEIRDQFNKEMVEAGLEDLQIERTTNK